MNENIKAFLKKLGEDKELQAKLEAIRDPEEAYKLASSVQSSFTKEEFIEAMIKLDEAINAFNELTDEDLAKVAGGVSTTEAATYVVSFSVSISSAASTSALLATVSSSAAAAV